MESMSTVQVILLPYFMILKNFLIVISLTKNELKIVYVQIILTTLDIALLLLQHCK